MKCLRGAAFVLAVTAGGGTALAQGPAPDADDLTVAGRPHLGVGAGYGGPLGPTVSGELIYGLSADVREESDRVRGVAGLLAQVQAGPGGGKLSLGAGGRVRVDSDDWKGAVAAGLKVSLARTWREPAESRRTYVGPEIDLSVKHVAVTLGALWRVQGPGGKGIVFSWGLGIRQ